MIDPSTSARLAGQVQRYATWPTLHTQSNGEHTWQVMRIFIEIFGAPAPEVTEFMLHHDTTELILGDPPFPLKRDNPVLKTIYTGLEPEAEMRIRGRVSPRLPEADRWRVKFCDVAEMWEFGMTEVDMGNRYAEMIEERTREELSRLLTVAPEGLWTIPAIEWVNSKESEYRS